MNAGKDMQFNRKIPFKMNLSGDRKFKGVGMKKLFHSHIMSAFDFTLYSDEARFNYENRLYNNVFCKSDFAGINISGSRSYTFYGNIMKNYVLLKSNFVANDKRWSWYTGELAGKPV
ncbi:MAG: hypothetical protein RQ760_02530 [Sedimentisphaerales bacterium]|nr:hypothetical protein [Sedimentisphaerales bacterium]